MKPHKTIKKHLGLIEMVGLAITSINDIEKILRVQSLYFVSYYKEHTIMTLKQVHLFVMLQ